MSSTAEPNGRARRDYIGRVNERNETDAERYDRISDFTKNIAIVPTCARSGEGIPDLLAMLVGLAQKF